MLTHEGFKKKKEQKTLKPCFKTDVLFFILNQYFYFISLQISLMLPFGDLNIQVKNQLLFMNRCSAQSVKMLFN